VHRRPAAGSALVRILRGAARAALLAAAVWPAVAAADERGPSRLQLEWQAPPGCLDRDEARAAIEAAPGASSRARGAKVVARVRIARLPDGRWNADIWMYGAQGSGERSFAGGSCAHVAEAAALIVAMALAPADEPEPARVRPPGPEPDASTPTRFFAGVRAAGDVGSLPEPSAGAGLAFGVEHGALRGELEAIAWLPQVARGAPPERVGGRFGLFTAALRGCVDAIPGSGAVQLGPCLGGEAGLATGRGEDISDPETNEHLWAAALLGLSLRHAGPSNLHLSLLVEAGVPLRRPPWGIDEFPDVFRASPVLGRASLTLAWRFP
jgi:hypothetical protein